MDKITFTKRSSDNETISVDILIESSCVIIKLETFVFYSQISNISRRLIDYSNHYNEGCIIELLNLKMKLFPANKNGHVLIEIDADIEDNYMEEWHLDNSVQKHKCSFYITSEIQLIENFGKNLKGLASRENGYEVKL